MFDAREAVLLAIALETAGRDFYMRARAYSNDEALRTFLSGLIEEEKQHIAVFEDMLGKDILQKTPWDEETLLYLCALAQEMTFAGGLTSVVSQEVSYAHMLRMAMESELRSITFYTPMAQRAKDADLQNVFGSILKEEQQHLEELRMRQDALMEPL